MKELSIEEKAKRYDEAIEIAKEINNEQQAQPFNVMTRVFPELKESEDGKIMKALVKLVKKAGEGYENISEGISIQKAIAWLEKQGEQKKVFKSDEMTTLEDKLSSLVVDAVHIYCKENKLDTPHCVGLILGDRLAKEWSKEILESAKKEFEEIESKPTDKVEPKFHEGDIIIHKELGGDYIHNPHKIIQVDILDKKYRLEGGLVAHFGEQEDYELVEQKPEWSEEDEYQFNTILHKLDLRKCVHEKDGNKEEAKRYEVHYNWLKSLKDRTFPQPKQEWSEEDEAHIDSILQRLEGMCQKGATFTRTRFAVSEDKDWLKSLRPQKQWKPSDEQMLVMEYIKNCFDFSKPSYREIFISVYKQLKAL